MSEYNGHEIYDVLSAWIKEISFAPQGINGKKYLLVKAMDKKELKKILTEDDEELSLALEKAGLFDESLEAAEIVGKLLKAYGDELPNGFLTVLAKAVGMEPPEGMEKGLEEEKLEKAGAWQKKSSRRPKEMAARVRTCTRSSKRPTRLSKRLF